MNCEINENKILILQDTLDIYDAHELKEKIMTVASANKSSIILDLQHVEDASTPVIQVLIAAKKSIDDVKIMNIKEGVANNLTLLGTAL